GVRLRPGRRRPVRARVRHAPVAAGRADRAPRRPDPDDGQPLGGPARRRAAAVLRVRPAAAAVPAQPPVPGLRRQGGVDHPAHRQPAARACRCGAGGVGARSGTARGPAAVPLLAAVPAGLPVRAAVPGQPGAAPAAQHQPGTHPAPAGYLTVPMPTLSLLSTVRFPALLHLAGAVALLAAMLLPAPARAIASSTGLVDSRQVVLVTS